VLAAGATASAQAPVFTSCKKPLGNPKQLNRWWLLISCSPKTKKRIKKPAEIAGFLVLCSALTIVSRAYPAG
jgi:hypothetical protein